ncbi:MAG: phosphate ABC transporter permease subunit PstC [Pseudomonadota bacterium]
MQLTTLLLIVTALSVVAFVIGRQRSLSLNKGRAQGLASLPTHYGSYVALLGLAPALLLCAFWLMLEPALVSGYAFQDLPDIYAAYSDDQRALLLNEVKNVAAANILDRAPAPELAALADKYSGLLAQSRSLMVAAVLSVFTLGALFAWRRVRPAFGARNRVESIIRKLLFTASLIAVLTTVGIVLSVLVETFRFFEKVPVHEFLFGLEWSPQTAIRDDQVGASGAFGAIPLIVGTLVITAIAMFVAVPVGLMTAVYLSEYASARFRTIAKPLLEVLAGIPTVVYGFFAALSVAPYLRRTGEAWGLSVSSESALAAGLVMGIMIIPLVSSLADDAISAVPRAMRDGSLGLGATRSETMRQVIFPAALPGIVGGILLAVSRAIGETMIVVMAAGLAANLTVNPLEAVTTVTVQIVTLLQGDQEFESAKTLAAFALGMFLFLVTLCLNIAGLRVVRKYREQYE